MPNLSLMVIDPSITHPEIESFNKIVESCPFPCTYHLPVLSEIDSISRSLPHSCGVIILGSAASVHDRTDWQLVLGEVLDKAIINDIPVLGICFGHQLLCKALGGEVEKAPHRTDSVSPLFSVGMDTLLSPTRKGLFTHQDHVTRLPPGARRIISSKHCENAGMRIAGKPVWGVQFHPEASRTVIEQAHADGDMSDSEREAFDQEHDGGDLLAAFAKLCMP